FAPFFIPFRVRRFWAPCCSLAILAVRLPARCVPAILCSPMFFSQSILLFWSGEGSICAMTGFALLFRCGGVISSKSIFILDIQKIYRQNKRRFRYAVHGDRESQQRF